MAQTTTVTPQHQTSPPGSHPRPVVGMVLHKPYPPDPRVTREARALMQAGHAVVLLCARRPGEPLEERMPDGLLVVRSLFETSPPMAQIPPDDTPPSRRWPVAIKVAPYNQRYRHLYVYLGPRHLVFRIPSRLIRFFHLFYRHPRTGDFVLQFRKGRINIPRRWYNPWAWQQANRDFTRYRKQKQFLNRTWCMAVWQFVQQQGIGILHVHDLPLLYSALLASEPFDIPVVADFHENWPALVHINRSRFKTERDRQRNRLEVWEAHERWCAQRAARVITVTESARHRLAGAGIPVHKIRVVSNTVDIEAFLSKPVDETVTAATRDRFVVSYIGGFGPHRGIDTLLRAACMLKEKIPNLLLFLAGADSPSTTHYLDYCRDLARELGVDGITRFTGWADDNDYGTYTAMSDVGVIPHKANSHTQTTMPNKIFHYMLYKKPVVCSNLAPLTAILEETGCGLWFPSDDPEALAGQILTLYDDPGLRERLGQRGYDGVHRHYNWKITSKALTDLYDDLVRQHFTGVLRREDLV